MKSAKEVIEELKTAGIVISRARLSQYTNGREKQSGKNKKILSQEALLKEGEDFERKIENGRAKVYFKESAVEKIKSKLNK